MECVFLRNEHQRRVSPSKSRNESDPRDVVPRCCVLSAERLCGECEPRKDYAAVEKYIRFGVCVEIGHKLYLYRYKLYMYVYIYSIYV